MMVRVEFNGGWNWFEVVGECEVAEVLTFCEAWFNEHVELGQCGERFEDWTEAFDYYDEAGRHCIVHLIED